MVEFREVRMAEHRGFVQEMFVSRAFENAPAASRRTGLQEFRRKWMETPGSHALLNAFEASLADPDTIARVVCVNGSNAGLIWVTPGQEPGEPPYAELRLVAFYLHFQRQGLGRMSLGYIESVLRERGTLVLRSTGSAPSDGVRRFHESMGFEAVQTVFEKQLAGNPTSEA